MRLELTRRADYAIRAAVALARQPETVLSGARIAREMGIPPRFVAQVMGDLVQARLVEARNGRNGGYRLARSADEVSVLDVVQAVEGDARRRTCVLRGDTCSREGHCDLHAVFTAAQDALLERLAGATLAAAVRPSAGSLAPADAPASR